MNSGVGGKLDIKPMAEIIVHESDQEMLTLAIDLFLQVCRYIDDENFGIVVSRLVSRLESSNGLVAVGFIENLQTIFLSVDQAVISQSIYTIQSFCDYKDCEIVSAELMRLDLIQTLNDLCTKYSDNSGLKTRIIEVAGRVASKMRNFPVSLVRSLVFEQLTMPVCDAGIRDSLYLFEYVNDMIQKSTNKAEMIKCFENMEFIVKLLKILVDFADNHPDNSIRTELDQGGILENLMFIVKSNTTNHTNKRVAGQIIEACFQHLVHVASSSIQLYKDNAEIDMKSGMAGYTHGNARTLAQMRYVRYLQCILCKPMWWIDITNQHIVEQWRADSLGQNILPSTFNLALEQLRGFVKQLVCNGSDGFGTIVPGLLN
ncbi:hypothetical protein BSLG_005863 [Batrachochytrium salamandrivorans]|nr:hypothetical protein BSLG_005863 [Batrachochytrium salamandrivorans]